MKYDLTRFIKAQQKVYQTALAEIRSGRKTGHWIWYIFPQLKGLGRSYNSQYYGIADAGEAAEYINNSCLGEHLREICGALLSLDSSSAQEVMGYPDDLKLRSCMTLFANVAEDNQIFLDVLDQYFDGVQDPATLQMLAHND